MSILLLSLSWFSTAAVARTPAQDAMPLDRYLTADDVRPVLHAASPDLATCFDGTGLAEAVVSLSLGIARDGGVAAVEVRAAVPPGAPVECVVDVVQGLRFREHDEALETWRYSVVWKLGNVQDFPTVERVTRPPTPLFLYLPPAALERLSEHVGVPLGGASRGHGAEPPQEPVEAEPAGVP